MYRSISLLSFFLTFLPSHSFPSSPSLPPLPPLCSPLVPSPPFRPTSPPSLRGYMLRAAKEPPKAGDMVYLIAVSWWERWKSIVRYDVSGPSPLVQLTPYTAPLHTTAHHTSQNSLARRYTCTYVRTSVPPGTYVQVLGIYADTVRSIQRVSLAC